MLNRYTKFFSAGIILLMLSCSRHKTPQDGYYFQDFENLSQWFPKEITPRVTNEFSKSGEFSTKMEALEPYSQSFEKKMSEIKAKGYKKVKIKVWGALSNTSAKCKLIASVNTDDRVFYWNGISYNEFISKPMKWGSIRMAVDLEKFPGEGVFKVYAKIDGNEKAFMDDVEIQFLK